MNNCQECHQALQHNIFNSQSMACSHCGRKKSRQSATRVIQREVIRNMVIASIGFLAVFYHFSNWGSHSLSIVFLKATQVLRVGSSKQYSKLHKICQSLKRYDCMEGALKDHYKASKDTKSLRSLALLQMRRGKDQEAVQTYKEYFEKFSEENFDKQSAFNYAKLLNHLGKPDMALEYYGKIINQEKDVIPVNAVRNKIQILVQLNRQKEAQKIVQRYKALAKDDHYITQEMNNLEKQVLNNS